MSKGLPLVWQSNNKRKRRGYASDMEVGYAIGIWMLFSERRVYFHQVINDYHNVQEMHKFYRLSDFRASPYAKSKNKYNMNNDVCYKNTEALEREIERTWEHYTDYKSISVQISKNFITVCTKLY